MGKTLHSWNKGAEGFFGYTAEEIIGRPLTLLFPPEGKDEADALLTRIAAGEEPGNYDVLKHHEWWDGRGYPLQIKAEDIPLECRLLAIADAYDAMTSERPYRHAMSHAEAVAELRRHAGTQFDPDLVEKFLQVISNST
ncbi:MAG: PAS domain S-box protein [Moorella humiferrea]|nr:PAS domain S-box protein [Moorella humiferrea]